MDLKSINIHSLKRLLDPQAFKDLDRFLDNLPVTAGYNALIAAGLVWMLAGGALLFATTEASKVSELRTELLEVESLRPPVPKIEFTPVSKATLEKFVKSVEDLELYPILGFNVEEGKIKITGSDQDFNAFNFAVGHVMSGGKNWHVSLDSFCLGVECKPNTLRADLNVSVIQVKDAPS